MNIEASDFEKLILTNVEPIIKEYSIPELKDLKDRNCNLIRQFVIDSLIKSKNIKRYAVRGTIDGYVNYLDMSFRENNSFVPQIFYDLNNFRKFKDNIVKSLGYRRITYCLVDIYKYIKTLSSDNSDYDVVLDIFENLRKCCNGLRINSITRDQLDDFLTNPHNKELKEYRINAVLNDELITPCPETLPYHIYCVNDSNKHMININEPTFYYDSKTYQKIKTKNK